MRTRAPWPCLDAQRGALFPWVPVFLGAGIALYLALPWEPPTGFLTAIAALLLAVTLWLRRQPGRYPVLLAALLVLAGLLLGAGRAHLVAAPVLEQRYYGAVEGRILRIDRSASDAPRLTLDRVVLERPPDRTPRRIRVSLHGQQGWIRPEPGMTVVLTGSLAPPPGPAEPGGYDFRRRAWFDGLGALGYTRNPVLTLAPSDGGVWLHRMRMRLAAAVRDGVGGRAGAFAAAITAGDRSAIDRAVMEDLRAANLAHLLAISGLHMGLLTGFVFAVLRLALVLPPGLALNRPVKAWAAVGALIAGAVYLALSGGNVATQRAFVMVTVVLGAVLVGRRALTLRAVAVAALIVLLLRPESVVEPGFQMSFAATLALVVVFRVLRDRMRGVARPLRPVLALVVSSAVAGAATAPFAAAHFNQLSQYGLVANLLTVPLMGAVIVPAAVLALILAPLGLDWIGFALMGPPIDWILAVAQRIAALDGAVRPVVAPQPAVLPLLTGGALWLALWQGRGRLAGLAPMVAALALWSQAERPSLLISESGGLVGLMTPEGRSLSRERGEGFVAARWLENDGDPADQLQAAARPAFAGPRGQRSFTLSGSPALHLTGRGAAAAAAQACRPGRIVVLAGRYEGPRNCLMLDRVALAAGGGVALPAGAADPSAELRRALQPGGGLRLWERPPPMPPDDGTDQ